MVNEYVVRSVQEYVNKPRVTLWESKSKLIYCKLIYCQPDTDAYGMSKGIQVFCMNDNIQCQLTSTNCIIEMPQGAESCIVFSIDQYKYKNVNTKGILYINVPKSIKELEIYGSCPYKIQILNKEVKSLKTICLEDCVIMTLEGLMHLDLSNCDIVHRNIKKVKINCKYLNRMKLKSIASNCIEVINNTNLMTVFKYIENDVDVTVPGFLEQTLKHAPLMFWQKTFKKNVNRLEGLMLIRYNRMIHVMNTTSKDQKAKKDGMKW